MKNILIKNPFLFAITFLFIALIGYQELKSFLFGLFFLIISFCLFMIAFFKGD
jgi:hypothetical protein